MVESLISKRLLEVISRSPAGKSKEHKHPIEEGHHKGRHRAVPQSDYNHVVLG
jgi:hypothetical protein